MITLENKIILSWDDVRLLVDKLCEKIIMDLPNIDSIYGIPRGGLIPATLVSHKLNLPWSNVMLPNTLVIDDICDSGKTIRDSVGVNTATLYYKPNDVAKPTIFAEEIITSKWVIFPWEQPEAPMIQDYLK